MNGIKRIEYIRKLEENQERLMRENKVLEEMLSAFQDECKHLYIKTGVAANIGFHECLFCDKLYTQNECVKIDIPYLDATNYKSYLCGSGETEEERKDRMEHVRDLYTRISKAYPEKNDKEVISILHSELSAGEKITCIHHQKKIGRR